MSRLRAVVEDATEQVGRLHVARAHLASALDDLARVAGEEAQPAIAEESRAAARVLRSHAKRPPDVDLGPLWGALSAAQRAEVLSDRLDAHAGAVRRSEIDVDFAAHDLATARGEDA